YLKTETLGSEPTLGPSLAVALGVAVVATIVLSVYPRLLFELAEASVRSSGIAAALRRNDSKLQVSSLKFQRRQSSNLRLGEAFHKVCYTHMTDDEGGPFVAWSL